MTDMASPTAAQRVALFAVIHYVPLLRAAADAALLGFTGADLAGQAQAISTGARYELRVRVTRT
ncbi:hypothetical protein ACF07V_36390 [Streptomyces sp. NPDC015661]|uniref:hypothetical protein n=1 Tax=Streptomyces sp. NPDC015661 TaxID=3364961 RepID=UPI003701E09D